MSKILIDEATVKLALEALESQHRDRLRYTLAKKSANATCAEFKPNTMSELIESAYMHGIGKQTESAITAIKQALEQPVQEPVAWQVHPFDYGIGHQGVYARTDRLEQVEIWKRKGWTVQPLYTHPSPTVSVQEPVELEMDGKQLTFGEALDEAIAATERSASKRLNTVLVAAKNAIYTTQPAAQPAPVQEPVAWRVKWPAIGGGHKWIMVDKPLMDEQIDAAVKAWFETEIVAGRQPFAKRMRAAIEAAHGIKENT